ncbi:MAG: Smr/MutS family protein, partial [Methyloceanibacter sp.]
DNDEGVDLWARVVGSAAPLKGRNRVPFKAEPPKPTPAPAKQPPLPLRAKAKPVLKRPPAPAAVNLDRKTARHLEKGSLAVEARLDLHGLRRRDAHAQLRRFLKTAQARGQRHVLVITGKGAVQTESKSFYEEEERGVLRQAVPRWLAEPDLADLVVSFSLAPRRLGGEGALYVRLRRPRA